MVTPFDGEGKILEEAHRAEVRYLLGADVHGLAGCGSRGPGPCGRRCERSFNAADGDAVRRRRKDQSASDMKALADLLLLIEEAGMAGSVRILSAVDALLYPSISLGAHGAVAAVLAAPQWCVELWRAVSSGDHARALELRKKLLRLWNAIDAPNLPANVKTAMRLQGRQAGAPRAPMPPSSAEEVERIRRALDKAEPHAAGLP